MEVEAQLIKSKKGEIEFREKLSQQQVNGSRIFDDEYDRQGVEAILAERMSRTFKQMSLLKSQGIPISPYVEIGAERCQRSLVMENDFAASGAAVDISYPSLRTCGYYADKFARKTLPLRICCDAYNLPFLTGSIPFVFCYETLHHFPDPTPIVKEAHRILTPGGHFYFDEEPVKQFLHINLYDGKKIYSKKALERDRVSQIVDSFFARRRCNEVNHDIVENDQISVRAWKHALDLFEKKSVELKMPFGKVDLFHPQDSARYLLAFMFGGSISGVCRKSGFVDDSRVSIDRRLRCPTCAESSKEVMLSHIMQGLYCSSCGKIYPTVEGVIFLLPDSTFRELYPMYAEEKKERV
jgi:SAM-dependent methyltransferase